MPLPPVLRRAASNLLAVLGAFAFVGAAIQLLSAVRGDAGRWQGFAISAALLAASWSVAFRLNRPHSQAMTSGHIVLFETPMPGVTMSHTPALTIRGPRDAIERFIPSNEFDVLFEGWALWRAPRRPVPEMPGEALGVWSRRTCKRFRRILRERGATIEVRREPGPEQRIARLVARRVPNAPR